MNALRERELVYARAMRARGTPVVHPPTEILESWQRCLDAGLKPAQAPRLSVVGERQLQRRREQSEAVRRLALAELDTLFHQIAGSNFLLAFADRDGVILDLYADNRFALSSSGRDIVVGSHWTEQVAGTNGLGTALASGKSVAVNGPEHFFTHFGQISCTASPIRDAGGCIVGVLDASSYFESRQRHTQALVQMAASHIENLLFARERRDDMLLAVHPRAEFLATLSAGLLALDDNGCLTAFNARAEALLCGLDMRIGASFEQLFSEPFARLHGQLQRHADVPLRDALGSSLVASWINRRTRVVVRADAARAAAPAPAIAAATLAAECVADDPAMQQALQAATAAVKSGAPLLLRGETGTGKEVLARFAHRASGRSGAFVAIDCGQLPTERCEAALFGYMAGAFEGARREGQGGLIASADGGTLLLDEVSHLAPPAQAALLRFLDDQTVRPVGGGAARQVNVQILASTNADLDAAVAGKRFRADLLYRLNTVCVDLPPLRSRTDFAACVRATLARVDALATMSDAAVERLAGHGWPGNFRELRAVLTRLVLLQPGRRIDERDLAAVLPVQPSAAPGVSVLRRSAAEAVRQEFGRTGGSVSQTARNLGVSRTTVYRHLRDAQACAAPMSADRCARPSADARARREDHGSPSQ